MPVGTQGTVKSITPTHLHEIGAQIILGNTYHLNLRPGSELIRDLGGLHKFMGWNGPILTDSGGFQVFSLAKLRDIKDEGVAFQSHLDGAKLFLGPREVMTIQQNLGSDIAMVIDECPPWPCERDACAKAVARSYRWAKQCREIATENGFLAAGHHVFAIVQGSTFDDLRREAAESLAALDFPGYAVGGVSVGEPEPEMLKQVGATTPFLPADKPRYAIGCIIEHGGFGASAAAPIVRDTMTYLFDKQKAFAALAPLEEQWGGTLAERNARQLDAFKAASRATQA